MAKICLEELHSIGLPESEIIILTLLTHAQEPCRSLTSFNTERSGRQCTNECNYNSTMWLHLKQGGETALHWAALGNNIPATEILLQAKADPTIKNSSGETPFQLVKSDQLRSILAGTSHASSTSHMIQMVRRHLRTSVPKSHTHPIKEKLQPSQWPNPNPLKSKRWKSPSKNKWQDQWMLLQSQHNSIYSRDYRHNNSQ